MGSIQPLDVLLSAGELTGTGAAFGSLGTVNEVINGTTNNPDTYVSPVVDLGSGTSLAKVLATLNASTAFSNLQVRAAATPPVTAIDGGLWVSGKLPAASDPYPVSGSSTVIDTFSVAGTPNPAIWTLTTPSPSTIVNIGGKMRMAAGGTTGLVIPIATYVTAVSGSFDATVLVDYVSAGTVDNLTLSMVQDASNDVQVYLEVQSGAVTARLNLAGSTTFVHTTVALGTVTKLRVQRTAAGHFIWSFFVGSTETVIRDVTTLFNGNVTLSLQTPLESDANGYGEYASPTLNAVLVPWTTITNGATSGLPAGRYAQWQGTWNNASAPPQLSNMTLATTLTPPAQASMTAAEVIASGGNYLLAASWAASGAATFDHTELSTDGVNVATDVNGNKLWTSGHVADNALGWVASTSPANIYARYVDNSNNAGAWSASKGVTAAGGGGSGSRWNSQWN